MRNLENKKIIKLGIVINSYEVPKWIEKIISHIKDSTFVDLRVVILQKETKQKNHKYSHFLYKLYCQLDYRYFSSKVENNAFQKTNIESILARTKIVDKLNHDDIEILKNENLDVILQFGAPGIMKDLVGLSKYGIWYYEHDKFGEGYSMEPKFFKSMFEREFSHEITLNLMMEKGNHIIYKSQSPVTRDSLFFNTNSAYWKASEFMIRRLHDLSEKGMESFWEKNDSGDTIIQDHFFPSNLNMLSHLSRIFMNKINSRFFNEQWILAFKEMNNDQEVYSVIKPPKDRFYADPFIMKRDHKTFIFFEEYIYKKGRGDISVLEIDPETKKVSEPITVLAKPYHLSYPFLYEREGETYMIPETSGNKTIELYKAVQFPYQWELEKVLIHNINAVDATIIEQNDKLWLFANVFADGASSLDELHIFHSDSLLGEWKPHTLNPVISNASSARPAGKIYFKDGKLVRPSQDCSFSYGYSVKLNEIVELTEHSYREIQIDEIKPDWLKNNKGTHTYNFNEDYEVIDGRVAALRGF